MIRNLLATTALATLVASGAMAQTTPSPATTAPATQMAPEQPLVKRAEGHLASQVIGKSVYNGTGDGAESIGKVSDLVLDDKGDVKAIVVGVGGFLGIGQKNVALEYDLVKWSEQNDQEWLVVETTADALKAQPEFDANAYQPMPADADVAETKPATKEDLANAPKPEENANQSAATGAATGTATGAADDQSAINSDTANDTAASTDTGDRAAADTADTTTTGAIDRSQLKEMPAATISSDDFVGTTVYGANDENIGEIGDVILTQDGKIDAVVVDVGGFLGVGEKPVAVSMENLSFMSDNDGKLYLYTNFTEDQLKSQPEYVKDTYADSRDKMLITNQK